MGFLFWFGKDRLEMWQPKEHEQLYFQLLKSISNLWASQGEMPGFELQIMQTNKTIAKKTRLYKLGKRFVEAGAKYWDEYQREVGPAAVVWLELENGHFILFTRSEHKQDFISQIEWRSDDPPLDHPFEK
jgi:hypothetical protein